MRSARFYLLLLGVFFLAASAKAQYYFYDDNYYDSPLLFEIGASIGGMNCLTDLGGRKGTGKSFIKDVTLPTTRLCGSGYATATYMNVAALRVEATYGEVAASDNILKKNAASTFGRYERNLSFKSAIFELMIAAEIYPWNIFKKFDADISPARLNPYLLGGIGYYGFNPQAQINNTWVLLKPLHTEGEGFSEYPDRPNYEIKQFNIPVGFGVKYDLSTLLNFRVEFVYRILSTDYLDDVSQQQYVETAVFNNYYTGARLQDAIKLSDRRRELNPNGNFGDTQRGDPKHNDSYFSFNIKLGINVGRQRIRGRASH